MLIFEDKFGFELEICEIPQGNGEDSFKELQELFEDMLQSNIESFGSTSQTATPPSCSSSLYASCGESSSATNKRSCSEMNSGKEKTESSSGFHAGFEGFCFGVCSLSFPLA